MVLRRPGARAGRPQTCASQLRRSASSRSPPAHAWSGDAKQAKPEHRREALAVARPEVEVGLDNEHVLAGSDDCSRVDTGARDTPSLLADLVVADLTLDSDDLPPVFDPADRPASCTGVCDQLRSQD